MIKIFKLKSPDYLTNGSPPTFPDGFDVEIFNFNSLKLAWKNSKDHFSKEHVTTYLHNKKKFKILNYTSNKNYSNYRLHFCCNIFEN